MNELIVSASSGKTVNLRTKPSKNAMIVEAIPVHKKVQLISKYSDEWYEVQYEGFHGYMMAQFLKSTSNTLSKEDIREVYNSLKETLTLLEKLL